MEVDQERATDVEYDCCCRPDEKLEHQYDGHVLEQSHSQRRCLGMEAKHTVLAYNAQPYPAMEPMANASMYQILLSRACSMGKLDRSSPRT